MTESLTGARVRITGFLPEDPDPLPLGTEGTVTSVNNPGTDWEQIVVKWDNGRSLFLLPGDPFQVVTS